MNDQEIARSRKRLNRLGLAASKAKRSLVDFKDDSCSGVSVSWCEPKTTATRPRPIILHCHGGAYLVGSPTAYRGFGANLALAADARVGLIDYSLAPEAPYPAAPRDALAVYQRLLERGESPTQIAITGDSAGGNLALATLINIVQAKLPQAAAGVLLSPWADLTGSGESIVKNAKKDAMLPAARLQEAAKLYAGDTPLDDWRVSPVYGNFDGLPPLLTHVGKNEILRDDARRIHTAAKRAGVASELQEWPGVPHVFQAFADIIPEARQSIAQISAWLNQQWVPQDRG